jgi:hypothetical protein
MLQIAEKLDCDTIIYRHFLFTCTEHVVTATLEYFCTRYLEYIMMGTDTRKSDPELYSQAKHLEKAIRVWNKGTHKRATREAAAKK